MTSSCSTGTPLCIGVDGKSHQLVTLWENRRTVVCFTRHMGCMFCKEQVAALRSIEKDLLKNDIVPIVITIGKYQHIPKFKEETKFEGEVYVDEKLTGARCYEVVKLHTGEDNLFAALDDDNNNSAEEQNKERPFRKETLIASDRATKAGFTNGGYGDDATGELYTGDVLQVYYMCVIT